MYATVVRAGTANYCVAYCGCAWICCVLTSGSTHFGQFSAAWGRAGVAV